MKHGNMTWLVWKEYHQNRLIVFAMLFLLVVPYAIAILAFWRWGVYTLRPELAWYDYLSGAGLYSLCLSQLTMALIGGNAIAGERADRSAEFQAYQPIPRSKILGAKLLLVLVLIAVIWLPNASILWASKGGDAIGETLACFAIGGVTMFCVAWLLSSTLSSPTLPVLTGLFTPLLIAWGLMVVADAHDMLKNTLMEVWFPAICLTLSPLCFALGTWLYLRRVEP